MEHFLGEYLVGEGSLVEVAKTVKEFAGRVAECWIGCWRIWASQGRAGGSYGDPMDKGAGGA